MKTYGTEEASRKYTFCIDELDRDFQVVSVEITSENLNNPESPDYLFSKVDINLDRYRTISEHIEFFKSVIEGLENIREMIEVNRHEKHI